MVITSFPFLFHLLLSLSRPPSHPPAPLLQYCLSDTPEVRPLHPFKTAVQKYPITEMQPVYFLADSFAGGKKKIM